MPSPHITSGPLLNLVVDMKCCGHSCSEYDEFLYLAKVTLQCVTDAAPSINIITLFPPTGIPTQTLKTAVACIFFRVKVLMQ